MNRDDVEVLLSRATDPTNAGPGKAQHLAEKLPYLISAVRKYDRLKGGPAKKAAWEKVEMYAVNIKADLTK